MSVTRLSPAVQVTTPAGGTVTLTINPSNDTVTIKHGPVSCRITTADLIEAVRALGLLPADDPRSRHRLERADGLIREFVAARDAYRMGESDAVAARATAERLATAEAALAAFDATRDAGPPVQVPS